MFFVCQHRAMAVALHFIITLESVQRLNWKHISIIIVYTGLSQLLGREKEGKKKKFFITLNETFSILWLLLNGA